MAKVSKEFSLNPQVETVSAQFHVVGYPESKEIGILFLNSNNGKMEIRVTRKDAIELVQRITSFLL